MNQTEKTKTDAVQDAVAIANWNDEGGAPRTTKQRQVSHERQRPLRAADHQQADT
jgi:hypothetical protein